jgi:hypothetical protein
METNTAALHSAQSSVGILVLLLACALSLEMRNRREISLPRR